MDREWLVKLSQWRIARLTAATMIFLRARIYLLLGKRYRAFIDYCWLVRVARVDPYQRIARRVVFGAIETARQTGRNPIVDWYLASSVSSRMARSYKQFQSGGVNDLFRDLIVLKRSTPDEKGVILLKYARTFEAVVALLDISKLLERYTFVLEPCWAGFCDPAILMYCWPGHPVLVQCFTNEDYRFIETLGPPILPLDVGSSDWVNVDMFAYGPEQQRIYDVVMVANWGVHKRHAQLFRALRKISDRDIRVLLVGFPLGGRTSADIEREAAAIGNDRIRIDIVENLAHSDVARYLRQCKVLVFLTRKEGPNKALVEALFADVPVIVYDKSIGGAGNRVNAATGIFSSDEKLAESIMYMLDHRANFTPRAWALAHTGSAMARRTVNDALRTAITALGGLYTRSIVEKTNAPNLAYRDPAARTEFQNDYDFILACGRQRSLDDESQKSLGAKPPGRELGGAN